MVKKIVSLSIGFIIAGTCIAADSNYAAQGCLGMFKKNDPRLEGLVFANWGSRPYEYSWVSSVVSLAGKKVIDLGVGIPSQHTWYRYAVTQLHPSFYAGVDYDSRIKNEEISASNYEIKFMNMADLRYPENFFDVALCISTFEHIPYTVFMRCIKEAYRVLKDDGILVVTLDEWWDKDAQVCHANIWDDLERDLISKNMIDRTIGSFGLPDFLTLVKDYFVPTVDVVVDTHNKIITSVDGSITYYKKINKDATLLNSGAAVNSCVSYVVLKKVGHKDQ